MKKLKIAIVAILMLVGILQSKKEVKHDVNLNLNSVAHACNIIPESVDDYCWIVIYWDTSGSYTCDEGGHWSCYV